MEHWGSAIESHEQFPERVNVGFMQIEDELSVRLRVFERGVGETQACGTGACAAVVAGVRNGLLKRVRLCVLLCLEANCLSVGKKGVMCK